MRIRAANAVGFAGVEIFFVISGFIMFHAILLYLLGIAIFSMSHYRWVEKPRHRLFKKALMIKPKTVAMV